MGNTKKDTFFTYKESRISLESTSNLHRTYVEPTSNLRRIYVEPTSNLHRTYIGNHWKGSGFVISDQSEKNSFLQQILGYFVFYM